MRDEAEPCWLELYKILIKPFSKFCELLSSKDRIFTSFLCVRAVLLVILQVVQSQRTGRFEKICGLRDSTQKPPICF